MRRELTDALIRTLHAPAGGRLEIWDSRCEGLVLRVSDKGRVTFHARARATDGRKRFAGLGIWPTLSLAAARTEARVAIGLMQKGADPTAERRTARGERARMAAMPTLKDLNDAWAKVHARDTSSTYRREVSAVIERGCGAGAARAGHKPAVGRDLMTRRIDAIAADDIAAVVQATRARGDGEARHLVRALRRVFGFAVAVGHLPASVVDEFLRLTSGCGTRCAVTQPPGSLRTCRAGMKRNAATGQNPRITPSATQRQKGRLRSTAFERTGRRSRGAEHSRKARALRA